MNGSQLILSVVLAVLIFTVALNLSVGDFRSVARYPRSVASGLLTQFAIFPITTWGATMLLDLPPQIEVAMILIAACPGGATASVITHFAGGNTALSLSISALGAVLSTVLTPWNFYWMVSSNPATASWLKALSIDASSAGLSMTLVLTIPLAAGMAMAHYRPAMTKRIVKPLSLAAILTLVAFVIGNLFAQRQLLTLGVLPLLGIAIVHNGCGLLLGQAVAWVARLPFADRRAVVIEGGLQNVGFALGIIAAQFGNDVQMVVLAGMWGIWHSVSSLSLAAYWRFQDSRAA